MRSRNGGGSEIYARENGDVGLDSMGTERGRRWGLYMKRAVGG